MLNRKKFYKSKKRERIIKPNDSIYSPMKLNGNMNRERKLYLKEPLYTEKKKGKYKHYRQKFITTKIDSLDDENEKNSINKTSYNYYSNGTTENNRNRDDESPLNQYIMNSNKKKYNVTHQYNTKRNKNYDYSLLKQSFNPGKESSYQHLMDEDKSLKTLNPILYKNNNNNYSYKSKNTNTKGTQKNNNTTNNNTTNNNSRFETISEQFNSFYDNCNTIRNNHLLIKSYIMTKSRYEIKRGKRNFAKIPSVWKRIATFAARNFGLHQEKDKREQRKTSI